jgi:hypothetical protein
MATKHLTGIEVDINLSSNPKVRDMYTQPFAFHELQVFFKEHGLEVVTAEASPSEENPIHIKIFGPGTSVLKFVEQYLSEDPEDGVYTLLYC